MQSELLLKAIPTLSRCSSSNPLGDLLMVSHLQGSATGIMILGALAVSCATTLPPALDLPEGFPGHTKDEVLRNVRTSIPDTISTLEGNASLSIASALYSGTAQAHITIHREDTLLATLSGTPLRIEFGTLLLTPDSVLFFNRLENTLYFGGRAQLEALLPSIMLQEPIFDRVLGNLTPLRTGSVMTSDSTSYFLEQGAEVFRVDPRHWRAVHYTRLLSARETVESVTFDSFNAPQSVSVPHRVTWEYEPHNLRIMIRFKEIILNPPSLQLNFDVPATAKRIELGTSPGAN